MIADGELLGLLHAPGSVISTRTLASGQTRTTGWALVFVTVLGIAAAIVSAIVGSGALGGTPINHAAVVTPVASAGSVFGFWSVIYLGLAA